jgi:2-hydroxy-3-oxopropionate reductase
LKPKIAFLGTGLMGAPMAANLIAAGYSITVWNRNPDKARPLAAQGALLAEDPAAAARDAAIAITMLSDGPAVAEVLFERGVATCLSAGALVMDCSSIEPRRARDHAARLAEAGIGHLDAPVSGGTGGAAAASLAIMVGGSSEHFATGEAVLSELGRPTLVGPSGAGQLAKLCNQIIVAVTAGAVAEALLLAAAGGADPAAVRRALAGGFADCPILQVQGGRMIGRDFRPGGAVHTQLKDLDNILEIAGELGLELPLTGDAWALFRNLAEAGRAGCDQSAVLLELERRNPPARLGDGPDIMPD